MDFNENTEMMRSLDVYDNIILSYFILFGKMFEICTHVVSDLKKKKTTQTCCDLNIITIIIIVIIAIHSTLQCCTTQYMQLNYFMHEQFDGTEYNNFISPRSAV